MNTIWMALAVAALVQDPPAAPRSTWSEYMALGAEDQDDHHHHEHDNQVGFTIGPAAGWMKVRDADDGTWFGGAQARLHLGRVIAAEASITFHQNKFADGDIVVTQYPVQVSGLIYPFYGWPAKPYLVAGGGWYYTRIDFRDALSVFDDDTSKVFGAHIGVGVDFQLGPAAVLNVDVRWIFVDPNFDDAEDEEFDFIQAGVGLNIGF